MKQIIEAIKRFLEWVKFLLWYKPIEEPVPDTPYRLKATDVVKEFVVVTYHGQRISLHQNELLLWNNKKIMTRKEKRAMASKFAKKEARGEIIFQEIDGKLVAIKNKDYNTVNAK